MAKTGETPGQTETNHVTLDVDIAAGERVEIVIESLPGTGELRVIRSDQAAAVTSDDALADSKDSAGEFPAGRFQKKWKRLIQQVGKPITLQPNILFLVGIILYLVIHLWGLDKFPIYFSCDEAVNPVLANYLVRENFKSGDGELLPTFFKNGGQYCLSTSVYMQLPTALLFGISVVTTRATFAIISVLTAFWIGFALRDIF